MEREAGAVAGNGDGALTSSCDPAPLPAEKKRQGEDEAWNCPTIEGIGAAAEEPARKKAMLAPQQHDPAAAAPALGSWSPNPAPVVPAMVAKASDGGGWPLDKMEYSMEALAAKGKNNTVVDMVKQEDVTMTKVAAAVVTVFKREREGSGVILLPPPPPSSIKEEIGSKEESNPTPAAAAAAAAEDDKRRLHKRDRDGNAKVVAEEEDTKMEAGGDDAAAASNMKGKDRSADNAEEEMEDAAQPADKDKIVQQRKRMPRQKSEGRSRLRTKDREGGHASRGESSSVVAYRLGEGLPELVKLWKESASSSSEGGGGNGGGGGAAPTLEVRVPAELATTSNRQVRGSQLWGTDIYTDDSDVVAVLMHTGYYSPTASPPPSCISEIRATLRVLPPQNGYKSTLRNSVRSRAWGSASGCSYSIERCRIVKAGGGFADLEPCLNRMPVVAPTLAPAAMERTMTTRSASSNAHRQQRFIQEVTIQYNLCNEPWLKYSMSIVADRGLKKSLYTSARLKKGDVLYLETHAHRYELSYDGEKASSNGTAPAAAAAAAGGTTATSSQAPAQAPEKSGKDKASSSDKEKPHAHNGGICGDRNGDYAEHYKWARCNVPLPLSVVRSKGVPLPPDCIQVLEESLTWEEVQWSPTSVWVRGREFPLARAQFLSPGVSS